MTDQHGEPSELSTTVAVSVDSRVWKTIQTKSSELRSGLTESGGFSRFSKVFRQRGNAEILIFFFLSYWLILNLMLW